MSPAVWVNHGSICQLELFLKYPYSDILYVHTCASLLTHLLLRLPFDYMSNRNISKYTSMSVNKVTLQIFTQKWLQDMVTVWDSRNHELKKNVFLADRH